MAHPAIPVAFKWLDDTFYGVHTSGEFVVVPLTPDTPFMVSAFDAPVAGRLFDVRAPFIQRVPLGRAVYEYVGRNDNLTDEGHVRIVPDPADNSVGHLELRYCIATNLMNMQSLAQLGLRLSGATNDLGVYAQREFGGVLIKGA